MDFPYFSNRKFNRNLALAILGALIADGLGILPLSSWQFFGTTLKILLQTAGLAWIAYGLWKFKIGT